MLSRDTTRRLGKTDLEVSSIGLGTMQFSGGKSFFRFYLSAVPIEIEDEVVKVALESGINWIDTAEVYGSGESERAVAHALAAAGKSPGEVIITTKWMPLMKSARSVAESAKKSTHRLEPYPIDLYLVHQPYSRSSVKSQMDAMADLVDSGIIRAVGVSNFSSEKMTKAYEALSDRGIPFATNQVRFSLLDRSIESNGILERAKELGVTITAYTPLGMGLLTGRLHSNPEEIAVEQEATAAQVALSWVINCQGETIVTIPGASKSYQAEQNAGAMHVSLTREQINSLSSLSLDIS